jgi:hypothetical protein
MPAFKIPELLAYRLGCLLAQYEVRFGIKMAPEVTRVLQERAYTSPIWYTP